MRVSREKFAESRKRIVEAAATLFREKGFDGVGLADIMKAAGLTHGGFYGHFGSKEDLEAQALSLAMARSLTNWSQLVDSAAGRPLSALAGQYLSPYHRENRGEGCPAAALGADTARESERVRGAFTAGLEPVLALLSNVVRGRSKAQRRRKAIATLAEMVGAMILARAVNDPALSDEILAATSLNLSEASDSSHRAKGLSSLPKVGRTESKALQP
jgi:TetR/AcrR family transcriptional regulator, transcriptional repressor for nem operon